MKTFTNRELQRKYSSTHSRSDYSCFCNGSQLRLDLSAQPDNMENLSVLDKLSGPKVLGHLPPETGPHPLHHHHLYVHMRMQQWDQWRDSVSFLALL